MSDAWTASERLLLRAAIGPEPGAAVAYAQWRDTVDLDLLEPGAQRVLPLLAARAAGTADHPVTAQIGKVVRFSWLRSQMLITAVLPAVRTLLDRQIDVVLVKGAAVVAHTHGDWQLRPMDDLDVAVPRAQALHAARALQQIGMATPHLPDDPAESALFEQVHALDFHAAPGAELDLHWQVIHGSLHPQASLEFFGRAEPAMLRDLPVRMLSREDTLLEVLAHGARPSDKRPLQWATDAGLLLAGHGEAFDWDLLAGAAARHRVDGILAGALAELRTVAPQLLPDRLPAPLAAGARRRDRGGRGANWREFVARRTPPGERPAVGALAEFAREAVGVDRAREVPGRIATLATGGRVRTSAAGPAPLRDGAEIAALVPGGAPIDFTAAADGRRLLGGGWWASDSHGTWSRGRTAELFVPLPAGEGPFEVRLSVVPFLVRAAPSLRVGVRADGRLIDRWRFAGLTPQEHLRHLLLPAPRPGAGGVTLTFSFDRRVAPAHVSNIADTRPMGLALRWVELLDL